MGVSLNPQILTRLREIQLFVTVEFDGQRRLPPRPLAPFVEWDPCGITGRPLFIIVLDDAHDEVERWQTVTLLGPRIIWACDTLEIDMELTLRVRPGDSR